MDDEDDEGAGEDEGSSGKSVVWTMGACGGRRGEAPMAEGWEPDSEPTVMASASGEAPKAEA